MTRNILFNFAILCLIALSTCYAYQIYRDSSDSIRPLKYHVLSDPDRSVGRMRQYQNTLGQLRLWRRYIDDFNDDEMSQDYFHQYKYPDR